MSKGNSGSPCVLLITSDSLLDFFCVSSLSLKSYNFADLLLQFVLFFMDASLFIFFSCAYFLLCFFFVGLSDALCSYFLACLTKES